MNRLFPVCLPKYDDYINIICMYTTSITPAAGDRPQPPSAGMASSPVLDPAIEKMIRIQNLQKSLLTNYANRIPDERRWPSEYRDLTLAEALKVRLCVLFRELETRYPLTTGHKIAIAELITHFPNIGYDHQFTQALRALKTKLVADIPELAPDTIFSEWIFIQELIKGSHPDFKMDNPLGLIEESLEVKLCIGESVQEGSRGRLLSQVVNDLTERSIWLATEVTMDDLSEVLEQIEVLIAPLEKIIQDKSKGGKQAMLTQGNILKQAKVSIQTVKKCRRMIEERRGAIMASQRTLQHHLKEPNSSSMGIVKDQTRQFLIIIRLLGDEIKQAEAAAQGIALAWAIWLTGDELDEVNQRIDMEQLVPHFDLIVGSTLNINIDNTKTRPEEEINQGKIKWRARLKHTILDIEMTKSQYKDSLRDGYTAFDDGYKQLAATINSTFKTKKDDHLKELLKIPAVRKMSSIDKKLLFCNAKSSCWNTALIRYRLLTAIGLFGALKSTLESAAPILEQWLSKIAAEEAELMDPCLAYLDEIDHQEQIDRLMRRAKAAEQKQQEKMPSTTTQQSVIDTNDDEETVPIPEEVVPPKQENVDLSSSSLHNEELQLLSLMERVQAVPTAFLRNRRMLTHSQRECGQDITYHAHLVGSGLAWWRAHQLKEESMSDKELTRSVVRSVAILTEQACTLPHLQQGNTLSHNHLYLAGRVNQETSELLKKVNYGVVFCRYERESLMYYEQRQQIPPAGLQWIVDPSKADISGLVADALNFLDSSFSLNLDSELDLEPVPMIEPVRTQMVNMTAKVGRCLKKVSSQIEAAEGQEKLRWQETADQLIGLKQILDSMLNYANGSFLPAQGEGILAHLQVALEQMESALHIRRFKVDWRSHDLESFLTLRQCVVNETQRKHIEDFNIAGMGMNYPHRYLGSMKRAWRRGGALRDLSTPAAIDMRLKLFELSKHREDGMNLVKKRGKIQLNQAEQLRRRLFEMIQSTLEFIEQSSK